MKVKTISRNPEEYTRSRKGDLFKLPRNLDPALHPFEKAREYTRALNATKMERLFAKPFVASMQGHIDGVYCMAKHPNQLTTIISGSADGGIRLWDLSTQSSTWSAKAHSGFVNGVSFCPFSFKYVSAGADKLVKLWEPSRAEPIATFSGKSPFTGIDHHRNKSLFATSGGAVQVWDHERTEAVHTFAWGSETISTVKFNQSEGDIFASCGTDRSIVLYDIRMESPLSKLIMENRTNAIAWNPMESFIFSTANEDHNCYTFDMRNMEKALKIYKDHVSAVMDLDYSPTGDEIVTGSYDRSMRIYKVKEGHSRDIYHTKRMQRIFCIKYSMDSKYVLTGSDDGNIRIWKAHASEKMGVKNAREISHLNYCEKLKERYQHMPEIKRISRHRYVPKAIDNARKKKNIMVASSQRKEENRRRHSKPGTVPYVSEKKKHIVGVQE